jgi:hypothetical protein
MSVRRGFLSLLAVLGLLAARALFDRGTARAQPESEELAVKNPLIDCSTNSAYDNQYIASAFKAGGGHSGGRNQQCSACHRSDSPRAGTGDKPVARQGTALIQNRLSEPVTYSVMFGKKGKWETFELKPGAVRRHSYKYGTPNQNRSPEVWVKFAGPRGKEEERQLTLVATPNAKLGSVYFFDRDEKDRQAYLWVPTRVVSRR